VPYAEKVRKSVLKAENMYKNCKRKISLFIAKKVWESVQKAEKVHKSKNKSTKNKQKRKEFCHLFASILPLFDDFLPLFVKF
jgi:hypothetical protein